MLYRGPVTGLSFHQYSRFINLIEVGTELVVRPIFNEHDAYALGVFFVKDNGVQEQIGWIPKGKNIELWEWMEEQKTNQYPAIVTSHNCQGDFSPGFTSMSWRDRNLPSTIRDE